MNHQMTELLYPVANGAAQSFVSGTTPMKSLSFLGNNANRKAYDIAVGALGTIGTRYVPGAHKSGARLAAAAALSDLAFLFTNEARGVSATSTGADVPVLTYTPTGARAGKVIPFPQPTQPAAASLFGGL